MKRLYALLAALMVATPAAADDTEGKAILDFANPPGALAQCRLVGMDGKNVVGDPGRSSWWVEPGNHDLKVTCLIERSAGGRRENPLFSGHKPKVERQEHAGETLITVEAGKRYKIAAQVHEDGTWEPVLYDVTEAK